MNKLSFLSVFVLVVHIVALLIVVLWKRPTYEEEQIPIVQKIKKQKPKPVSDTISEIQLPPQLSQNILHEEKTHPQEPINPRDYHPLPVIPPEIKPRKGSTYLVELLGTNPGKPDSENVKKFWKFYDTLIEKIKLISLFIQQQKEKDKKRKKELEEVEKLIKQQEKIANDLAQDKQKLSELFDELAETTPKSQTEKRLNSLWKKHLSKQKKHFAKLNKNVYKIQDSVNKKLNQIIASQKKKDTVEAKQRNERIKKLNKLKRNVSDMEILVNKLDKVSKYRPLVYYTKSRESIYVPVDPTQGEVFGGQSDSEELSSRSLRTPSTSLSDLEAATKEEQIKRNWAEQALSHPLSLIKPNVGLGVDVLLQRPDSPVLENPEFYGYDTTKVEEYDTDFD